MKNETKHTPTPNEELLSAAKALLEDAEDREETTDDDGNEYADYKRLREAIAKAEAPQ